MARTRALLPSLIAAAVLILAGCGWPFADPGPATTQTRDVSGVTAVELDTSGSLTVTAGDRPGLTIRAGRDVIDRLSSDVRGGVLTLGVHGQIRQLGTVRYDLTLPQLTELTLDGSGDVRIGAVPGSPVTLTVRGSGDLTATGVDTETLEVQILGSGDVHLTGRAASQQVRIAGSGNYAAGGLSSEDATITIAGSGDADVDVGKRLEATVTGSGDVTYSGHPTVEAHVTGSGDVTAR